MRLSLPLAGRFVFTLHRVAGFDKKAISEMTGLKYSVIEAGIKMLEHHDAVEAAVPHLSRAVPAVF